MTLLLLIGSGFLVAVLMVTVANALTAPMLRRAPELRQTPKVSVLVPARDEAENIDSCLAGLQNQQYPDLEILVLDDYSEDTTARLVNARGDADQRVHLLQGEALPDGWTGKNWACYQLAQAAEGDILIFTDADNRHDPQAVASTVAWMQRYNLALASAFPQQYTITFAEKLVIPAIDMLVYALLPLWATYYLRVPFVAAANGQWIALTREAYDLLDGHGAVRDEVVEDVALSRLAKRHRLRVLTLAGTDRVFARMYRSAGEVWEGFSKNLFGLTGYRSLPFFALLTAFLVMCIVPYFAVWFPQYFIYAAGMLVLNLLIRAILSAKYRHPKLVGILLHPVGIAFMMMIGLNSFALRKRGRLRWKGRQISVDPD